MHTKYATGHKVDPILRICQVQKSIRMTCFGLAESKEIWVHRKKLILLVRKSLIKFVLVKHLFTFQRFKL